MIKSKNQYFKTQFDGFPVETLFEQLSPTLTVIPQQSVTIAQKILKLKNSHQDLLKTQKMSKTAQ